MTIAIFAPSRGSDDPQYLTELQTQKEFLEKSGIAVFTTNGNLETGENTFGHGRSGITQPFANFASANFIKQEDGSYSLEISGSRSQENLNFYYKSPIPQANKSDNKKTKGDISIEATTNLIWN